MLIEQQIKQFNALNKWFQSSLGLYVADEFNKQLTPLLEHLKGETLLQLGYCADNSWLSPLKFNNKWIASPVNIEAKVDLICSLNHVPLNRNSIDCVVAPLTMEPFNNTLSLIDEIDRILKPMGYVVFFSINPWSLWGGALKCGLVDCFSDRNLRMHTPFHLNRIFVQRGYRQCSLNNFCYTPPVKNPSLIRKFAFLNEIGKMLWPFPSGFYCYIAQKYEPISPTPLAQPIVQAIPKEYESPLQPTVNSSQKT